MLTWNTPSDVQGELTGYEVNIEIGNKQETKVIGPESSSYPTTDDQKKMGAKIRVSWHNEYTVNSNPYMYMYGIEY